MQTFSFDRSIFVSEEGDLLLVVKNFEAADSVLIITVENNKFSNIATEYWSYRRSEDTIS